MSPKRSTLHRPRCSPRSCTRIPAACARCAASCANWRCSSVTQPEPNGELRAAIVQDAGTNEVLMLAWMDDDALRLTQETGEAHFWSRSRRELWRKGETSGNTLTVEELRDDCDGDAILVRVTPAGPTCHTGALSCFAPRLSRPISQRAPE